MRSGEGGAGGQGCPSPSPQEKLQQHLMVSGGGLSLACGAVISALQYELGGLELGGRGGRGWLGPCGLRARTKSLVRCLLAF